MLLLNVLLYSVVSVFVILLLSGIELVVKFVGRVDRFVCVNIVCLIIDFVSVVVLLIVLIVFLIFIFN